MRTHYDALGVRTDADDEAIRLAFRMLAKAWHPDANPGDRWSEKRFKQITAAYVALRSPASRTAYDERLEAARRRLRERWTREVLYCVVAAAVTFVVASGGILLLRQQDASTASADAPPALEPASRSRPAPQDEQAPAAGDAARREPQRLDVAAPPAVEPGAEPTRDETARSPQLLERVGDFAAASTNGEPAGEAARRSAGRAGSAMPMDAGEVRVTISDPSGDVVRTVTVPREQSSSAGEPGGAQARPNMAAIRVWTARRRDGAASFRVQQFTVGRERRRAARWAGATPINGPDAWIPFASR